MQETQETQVRFLGQEDLLEKETAIYSSIFPWKIPWTEEPGRLHTVHGVAKSRTEPEIVFGPLRPAVPQLATRWQDDTLLTTAPPNPGRVNQHRLPSNPGPGSLPHPAA